MVVLCGLTTTVYSRQPASAPYGPVYKGAPYVVAAAPVVVTPPANYGAPAANYGAPAAAYRRERAEVYSGAPAADYPYRAPVAAYAGAPAAAFRREKAYRPPPPLGPNQRK